MPEAAFLAVLFTFNLLSLYQRNATPQTRYRQQLATLREWCSYAERDLGLSLAGKRCSILSAAWGGLDKHKPLLEAIFQWPEPTPPRS